MEKVVWRSDNRGIFHYCQVGPFTIRLMRCHPRPWYVIAEWNAGRFLQQDLSSRFKTLDQAKAEAMVVVTNKLRSAFDEWRMATR